MDETQTTVYEKLQIIRTSIANAAAAAVAYKHSWSYEYAMKHITQRCEAQRGALFHPMEWKLTRKEFYQELNHEQRMEFFGNWNDSDFYLIPLWMFNYIKDGEELVSIMGGEVVKGPDVDLDNRAGFIAYGFKPLATIKEIEKEKVKMIGG